MYGRDVTYGADVTDERIADISAAAGIYGDASDGKTQSINALLIDDGVRHCRHLWRRYIGAEVWRRDPVQSRRAWGRRREWAQDVTYGADVTYGRWHVRYADVTDREALAIAGIYGDASCGKGKNINALLIDDRRPPPSSMGRHLRRPCLSPQRPVRAEVIYGRDVTYGADVSRRSLASMGPPVTERDRTSMACP
jgi:hypothetical protein